MSYKDSIIILSQRLNELTKITQLICSSLYFEITEQILHVCRFLEKVSPYSVHKRDLKKEASCGWPGDLSAEDTHTEAGWPTPSLNNSPASSWELMPPTVKLPGKVPILLSVRGVHLPPDHVVTSS